MNKAKGSPAIASAFVMVLGTIEPTTGLFPAQVKQVLEQLSDTKEYVPIEFHENNTSAYGYIESDYYERYDYEYDRMVKCVCPILNDMKMETADGVYYLPDGARYRIFTF